MKNIIRFGAKYCAPLASMLLTLSLSAGTDFFALQLPSNLKDELIEIQRYVSHRLPRGVELSRTPRANMHITLKEISDLDQAQRHAIRQPIRDKVKTIDPFSIDNALKGARLKITRDGLVKLELRTTVRGDRSIQRLTNLASQIQDELKDLKRHDKIKELKSRMDFPNHGHITLGRLTKKVRGRTTSLTNTTPYKNDLDRITQRFRNSIRTPFKVENFVLLKSNAPARPRVYEYKGRFNLKQ